MRAAIGFAGAFAVAGLFFAPTAEAAVPSNVCVKASFRGNATTYNPYTGGWKTGGGITATGARYNPNDYSAALQLDLARQYRCGIGRGGICHAVVQAPNGRAMVVKVNDNGPMCADPATAARAPDCRGNRYARVIDLNEKSVRYLCGSSGNNCGFIRDVTVTLLCGIEGVPLGPLDESDRIAWAGRTFNTPYAYAPNASPFANASPFTTTAAPVGQSFAPRNVSSAPASGAYSSPAQPYPPARPVTPSAFTPPPAVSDTLLSSLTDTQVGLSSGQSSGADETKPGAGPAALSLIVQPRELRRGEQGLVSWTSVGTSACRVSVVSGNKDTRVGDGREGTRPIKMSASSATGVLTFTLKCTSARGESLQETAALNVR